MSANTPQRIAPIGVTMKVTAPKNWGQVAGTVTGKDCQGSIAPLGGAQVQANGKGYTSSLKTGPDGTYAIVAPTKSNPFTVIASNNGWIAQTTEVRLRSNKTTTQDFTLQKNC